MSVLERAARACAFYRDGGANFEAWDSLDDTAKAKYRLQAKAVLMSVRDNPNLPGVIQLESFRIAASECMAEMINAILDEETD